MNFRYRGVLLKELISIIKDKSLTNYFPLSSILRTSNNLSFLYRSYWRFNIFNNRNLLQPLSVILSLQKSQHKRQHDHRRSQNRSRCETRLEPRRIDCPPHRGCVPDGHDVAEHVARRNHKSSHLMIVWNEIRVPRKIRPWYPSREVRNIVREVFDTIRHVPGSQNRDSNECACLHDDDCWPSATSQQWRV